jgi:Flp pilus assembly protein TadG
MNKLPVNLDPKRQRGLAMVEMVFVVPILLLLMLATAELGRGFYHYNTLVKATRDGARHFATNPFVGSSSTVDAVRQSEAVCLVQYGKTDCSGIQLLPGDLPAVPLPTINTSGGITWVTVTASYPFQFLPGNPLSRIMGLSGRGLPNTLTLNATTTMRAL